ncbi:hypothetical protein N7471_003104 [Penicillium samsonianum]|uniref:uncharacterized protein n=1 Tax=Penicillium samsonianum TaxID=1882272 RepID=UPI0025473501|nr:uncharacterized protein N7471_003104 [Penicillium samsonianum]KAJ6143651.1 hypothetical protein N7471_003104 [Penicillium samsonianum]
MIFHNFRSFTQLAYGLSGHHVTVQQLDQLAVILKNGTKQSNISELPNSAQSPIARFPLSTACIHCVGNSVAIPDFDRILLS